MANLRDLFVVDNRIVSLHWKLGPVNTALLAIRMGDYGSDIPPNSPAEQPDHDRHEVVIDLGAAYQPDLARGNRRERFLKRLASHSVGRLVQFREHTRRDDPNDYHLHYVLFREPLIVIARSHARKRGRQSPDLMVRGVFIPPLLSKLRPSFFTSEVRIPQGDPRFGHDFVLDFESARRVPLDQQLRMDYPFVRAYDPLFCGYRCDRNGHNVLTNWVISVPLAFPSNWNDPALARIRTLQGFTQPAWKHVIWFLEGKILEEITPLAVDSASASVDTMTNPVGAGDHDAVEPRPQGRYGLCYAGWPHPRVKVVGNYFLVGVRCRAGISWEVDSPEPHTAFRSYRTEEHASMWAQRGDARRRLEHQLQIAPAFRVEHRRDTWQVEIPARRLTVFGPTLENGAPN